MGYARNLSRSRTANLMTEPFAGGNFVVTEIAGWMTPLDYVVVRFSSEYAILDLRRMRRRLSTRDDAAIG